MRCVMLLIGALTAGATLPAKAATPMLLLEWADHARDPKSIPGDPVYMRELFCPDAQGEIACTLLVVAIYRGLCPMNVEGSAYTSQSGDLRVTRTGDLVDVVFVDPKAENKLRLRLITDLIGSKIVAAASGVRVFKPEGDEVPRPAELVSFSKNTKGLEKHPEHLEVELGCSKMSVTATKK